MIKLIDKGVVYKNGRLVRASSSQKGNYKGGMAYNVLLNHDTGKDGKKLKITYSTQVSTNPPAFVFFVNESNLMHFSYKRYLENCIRKAFDFSYTPIRILFRQRDED